MEYKERQTIAKRKYRHSIKGKSIRKEYRISKNGKETEKRWRNSTKGKLYRKNYIKENPHYVRIAEATRNKYGSLINGFQYHHWKPYHKDNFVILESSFHRWYHSNIKKLIENKRNYGVYQPIQQTKLNVIITPLFPKEK